MKFSDPASARTINRLRVLNLLRTDGSLSRADIARSLTLNKPSTSEIVASLLAEGLIEEGPKVETKAGRRPIAITLKPDARVVLGVELGTLTTTFTLADLKGTPLRYERLPTPPEPDAKQWGEQIIKTCMKLASPSFPIAGIAVAMAATFTDDRKAIVRHENWNWESVPLAQAIEVHTKVPTTLVHNTEAMVTAERWFAREESETLLYVNWGQHINAAWVNKATITSGSSRFGHLPIAPTGLCQCGSIGCLETVAAGWALKERGDGASVKQMGQDSAPNPVLEEAAKGMGTALAWAAAITGVEKIIIGGGIANLGDHYFDLLKRTFVTTAHHELADTPLTRSALKERSSSLGSVAIALDHWIFKHSMLQTLKTY